MEDEEIEQLLAETAVNDDEEECLRHYEGSTISVSVCGFSCTTEYHERQMDWCLLDRSAASSGKMDLKHEFKDGCLQLSEEWNSMEVADHNEPTCVQDPTIAEDMSIQELQQAFKATFGRETDVMDKKWLECRIMLRSDSFSNTVNEYDMARYYFSYDDQCQCADNKSEQASMLHSTRTASKDSFVLVNNRGLAWEGCRKRSLRRLNKNTCRVKQMSLLMESHSRNESSGNRLTRGKKCKIRINNSHWTLSEVTKLVEGVSQYGVGRWAEIKKVHFFASPRTSVNLKDKWRNLLRTSGTELHYKKKVKPQQFLLLPLPQWVLQRIRELSVIHPYPRERRTKQRQM